MPHRLTFLTLLLVAGAVAANDADLLRDIQAVVKEKTPASPAARAAWEKLVARGPAVLPALLDAMDTPDTVVANWLRTAFDRIVDNDRKQGGKGVDSAVLLKVAQDMKRHGRVRRLALEVLDELKPGSSGPLIAGWLADPEFRHDAVAQLIKEGDALVKKNDKEQSLVVYRKAFAACRDVPQAQELARKLKELGDNVSLATHLGFLTDWYVIGPFDAHQQKGFKTVYPPEQKVDLAAELPGKSGMIKWKRLQVREATGGAPARVALVNLVEPLGVVEDGVAYAYTAITVDKPLEVEFRGAADDNLSVFVNGKREFGFEEYRNGVRLDRHRFRARLKAGENAILVKICQAPVDQNLNEPNWEFLLRVVDETGKGIDFKNALPAVEKK